MHRSHDTVDIISFIAMLAQMRAHGYDNIAFEGNGDIKVTIFPGADIGGEPISCETEYGATDKDGNDAELPMESVLAHLLEKAELELFETTHYSGCQTGECKNVNGRRVYCGDCYI